MKVTAEQGENQQVTLTIEVEAAEVSKAAERASKQLASRVSIPGFRKGKAPRKIVERHVGTEALMQEAFDLLAPKAFNDALEEQKIEPVTRPNIDIVTLEDGKDLVFKATVTPRPEVKLGEYKGLKVEKAAVEITDEDVEKQLKNFQDRQGKMVDAPEGAAVADGDFTTLDFEGFVDGEAFEGGKGKDYPLQIGSGSFIPGFEEQLIGVKVGEEKKFRSSSRKNTMRRNWPARMRLLNAPSAASSIKNFQRSMMNWLRKSAPSRRWMNSRRIFARICRRMRSARLKMTGTALPLSRLRKYHSGYPCRHD